MTSFGNSMLWGGLLTALLSLGAYVAHRRGNREARELARASFILSALTVVVASAVLKYGFLARRFDFAYVAEYSSRNLPLMYRISAFWAGQEGSFLLWALLGAVIGLVLMRRLRAWEAPVMIFFTAAQAFLLLLLVIKTPFRPSPEWLADGQGLNPLLQDPWMAIHPPLIFLGYAALAVPFAFAVAALLSREYEGWVARALPWTLFAWVSLGAGIFVGGYWAYRVLGWGGYWGWDPVENSSLIPWLLTTALLHGMLLQKARGSLKHANLFLAVVTFATVLYGTFLTRSGVLKDFSVHSFADSGMGLYWALLLGMVVAVAGPLLLLALRAREIQSTPTHDNLLSRDLAFFLGILVLCISAAVVTFGTSAPLITTLLAKVGLAKAPTSLQPEFYNGLHYPVAVLLALLVGAAPILAWNRSAAGVVAQRARRHLLAGLGGAVVFYLVGVHDGWMHPALGKVPGSQVGDYLVNHWNSAVAGHAGVHLLAALKAVPGSRMAALLVGVSNGLMLLLVAVAVFGLSANLAALARAWKGSRLNIGGNLAHVGLALMLAGIVGSAVYSRSEKVALFTGQTSRALGYQVTFDGLDRPSETRRDISLTLEKGGARFTAQPRMVLSQQMDGQWVHSPAVKRYWAQDLYISPVELREDAAAAGTPGHDGKSKVADLGKGESLSAGGYTFTFKAFDMSAHGEGGGAVGATIEVKGPDGKTSTVTPMVTPAASGGLTSKPAKVPGSGVSVAVTGMNVPHIQLEVTGLAAPKGAALATKPAAPRDQVIVEVSNKPAINLLWLGTVLVLAGGLVAIARRACESAGSEETPMKPAESSTGNGKGKSERRKGKAEKVATGR